MLNFGQYYWENSKYVIIFSVLTSIAAGLFTDSTTFIFWVSLIGLVNLVCVIGDHMKWSEYKKNK